MANNGTSAGTVRVTFALGALTGAVVALLCAPATGEETRRRLADRAREGRERASALARDSREFFERQRDNVSAAVDRGREAFEQVRKETL